MRFFNLLYKSSVTQASFLKVTPMPHKGLKEIVPVQHTTVIIFNNA